MIAAYAMVTPWQTSSMQPSKNVLVCQRADRFLPDFSYYNLIAEGYYALLPVSPAWHSATDEESHTHRRG